MKRKTVSLVRDILVIGCFVAFVGVLGAWEQGTISFLQMAVISALFLTASVKLVSYRPKASRHSHRRQSIKVSKKDVHSAA